MPCSQTPCWHLDSQSGPLLEVGGRGLKSGALWGKLILLEGSQVPSGTPDTSSFSWASQPRSQRLCSAMSSSHNVLPHRGPEQWDQHTVDGNLHLTEPGLEGVTLLREEQRSELCLIFPQKHAGKWRKKIYINLNSTSYGIFNSIILIEIKAFFHKNWRSLLPADLPC